jgi:hypothetical protein
MLALSVVRPLLVIPDIPGRDIGLGAYGLQLARLR